jgi:methionyl aminopeptidase
MIVLKNAIEIDRIRAACKIAVATLDYLEPYVVPGISTLELNRLAEAYIRSQNALPAPLGYHGYPAATCISLNDTVCHGIPSKYKLMEGDIVKVDVSTIYGGYFGDTCRTFPVGKISEEAAKLIRITKQCLDVGVQQVRPNHYIGDIGYEIEQLAIANGFSVTESYCGHGVGLALHEEPPIPHTGKKDTGAKMIPGMVFTIEPMINQGVAQNYLVESDGWTVKTADGKLSAQFEHTIAVTKDGYEILTS